MRRSLLLVTATPLLGILAACNGAAGTDEREAGQTTSATSTGWGGGGGNWGGGGGNWGGGGGEWGGGGGLWGGGGGFWGGGGGLWGGGGGNWGGGGGQWGGGGGYWGGGGGFWGGGGGNWGGGGGLWGGGEGDWGGGGGLWGGGFANTFPFLGWSYARHWQFRGVPQSGGITLQSESGTRSGATIATSYSGYTGTGYVQFSANGNYVQSTTAANTVAGKYNLQFRYSNGAAATRMLNLSINGGTAISQLFPSTGANTTWGISSITVPLNAGTNTIKLTANGTSNPVIDYVALVATNNFTAPRDSTVCPTDQVRLGGYAYGIDVEGWPSWVALGYSRPLCLPTPGDHGLTMNATVGDPSLTQAGGYEMIRYLDNAYSEALAMKSMVGWGAGNVATQYGGALCASIGSLAAAKRSCGVGIAFSDPNRNQDGSLSQRGVPVSAAQNGSFSSNTPFGRAQGHSLYGEAANDMESYASRALLKHTSKTVPTTANAIDAWNNTNTASFSYNGSNFAPVAITATPAAATANAASATTLFNNANRSVGAPLNMIAVDANTNGATSGNVVLSSDMNLGVQETPGDLYALSLHSLAVNQAPLYGSGGGRWFFHNPSDPNAANVPLMDLSSIYQGSTYILTGQLNGTNPSNASLSYPYISQLTLKYADWHGDTGSQRFINSAGQYPSTIGNDADRESRLAGALRLARPKSNMGSGYYHACAIASAGGGLKCWGGNGEGRLGINKETLWEKVVDVTGVSAGVAEIAGGRLHTCALLTSGVLKCWGNNADGEIGNGNRTDQWLPATVTGLGATPVSVSAGGYHTCAILSTGRVSCWGDNIYGQLGRQPDPVGSLVPVDVGLSDVAQIAAGHEHVCALTKAGAVQCWGRNDAGQLGDGTTTVRSAPTQVPGLTSRVLAIATGLSHTCALTANRTVKCWGANLGGQTDPTFLNDSQPIRSPKTVGALPSVPVQLALGQDHSCALMVGGSVACWGSSEFGQIGAGQIDPSNPKPPTTVQFASGDVVTEVVAGADHNCARLSTGAVKCWGRNIYGAIGDGSTTDRSLPKAVSNNPNNAAVIASQGSVLVNKFSSTDGQVSGHVMPIPFSMTNTATGKQALIVTYDPLAAAAAQFIEQYDAHIAACNATTNETDIKEDDGGTYTNGVKQGKRLWACSKPATKTEYLHGMQTFLNGARYYLFGTYTACIAPQTQQEPYASCSIANIDWSQAHLPYTLWVPDYQTTGAPYYGGTDSTSYFSKVNTAVSAYRTSILGAAGTRLEKTLQLAGVAKFTTNTAIVTSRVTRPGNFGTDCIASDGFASEE